MKYTFKYNYLIAVVIAQEIFMTPQDKVYDNHKAPPASLRMQGDLII